MIPTLSEKLVSTNTGQNIKLNLIAICKLLGNILSKGSRVAGLHIIDNFLLHECLWKLFQHLCHFSVSFLDLYLLIKLLMLSFLSLGLNSFPFTLVIHQVQFYLKNISSKQNFFIFMLAPSLGHYEFLLCLLQ